MVAAVALLLFDLSSVYWVGLSTEVVHSKGVGALRFSHKLAIDKRYLMSSLKSLLKSFVGSYWVSLAHWRVDTLVTISSVEVLATAVFPASALCFKKKKRSSFLIYLLIRLYIMVAKTNQIRQELIT